MPSQQVCELSEKINIELRDFCFSIKDKYLEEGYDLDTVGGVLAGALCFGVSQVCGMKGGIPNDTLSKLSQLLIDTANNYMDEYEDSLSHE